MRDHLMGWAPAVGAGDREFDFRTADGMAWASHFAEKFDRVPGVGTLVGWFANAIEAGRDAGARAAALEGAATLEHTRELLAKHSAEVADLRAERLALMAKAEALQKDLDKAQYVVSSLASAPASLNGFTRPFSGGPRPKVEVVIGRHAGDVVSLDARVNGAYVRVAKMELRENAYQAIDVSEFAG